MGLAQRKLDSLMYVRFALAVVATSLSLVGCSGGGSGSSPLAPKSGFTVSSGVAQKGPLILGSTVTAQELDASLSPTGKQYSYQTTDDFGTFNPASIYSSQYIGVDANGYYFDEVADTVSSGPITLNAYADLSAESVLNVNILTTLAYRRIQNLVTKSRLSFAAAQTQAQGEVLAALNIRSVGDIGAFDTLDISKGSDSDKILAAISSLFVYGNTAGNLSQLMASFQNDLGTNGVITSAATIATLKASAAALNPAAVAANLTQKYSSLGVSFTATDISNWIDQDGDGVVGNFKFQVANASQSSSFTFPASLVNANAGGSISVSTGGQLSVNGTTFTGTMTIKMGDVVKVSPSSNSFANDALAVYLLNGTTRIARVDFVGGLVSIAVTPSNPNLPLGLTQRFTATGAFTDGGTKDLSSSVQWASSAPNIASVAATGIATALTTGQATLSATSGPISGSATVNVVAAAVQSISITPNPFTTGVGIARQLTATGTFSDGSKANITASAAWSSSDMTIATVTGGTASGVAPGSTTITATSGGYSGSNTLNVTANNTWNVAGSLNVPRIGQVTILLPTSGKVLAVNGVGELFNPFEIYDPTTDNWSQAGYSPSNAVGVRGQTLTWLGTGKVLIAGGVNHLGSCASNAWLYDPNTQTSVSTGSMLFSRGGHTATLLKDGSVLVAGGGCVGSGPSSEIYYPSSGTWSSTTGNMLYPRSGHTATLLPDGRVLVAGGDAPASSPRTAEIYDPMSGTWSAAGTMSSARDEHTATLLPDGRVLVTGGSIVLGSSVQVLVSSEIYNPSTNAWSLTAAMSSPRTGHAAALLNGKVLVAGGSSGKDNNGVDMVLSSATLFDPASGTWSPAASLITGRAYHTATLLLNGTVLVTGGESTQLSGGSEVAVPLQSSELYW
jgi:hypothetical protein